MLLLPLYSELAGQGVLEDAELGSSEGENDEQNGDHAKPDEGTLGVLATQLAAVEKSSLVNICNGCRNEEDSDVYPVGRLADNAVIGVEKDGYENKPEKSAAQLYAPKILAILKEEALHDGEDKHRPKQ